jgi:uncharacterized protein YecE (DUF72 family)
MDFGKLTNVDHVDFGLRPDPPGNAHALSHLPPREGPPRVYIGPTGYNTKEWVGKWYPTGAKERDFLKYFGQQFNTVEHNTTHYRIPDTATVERWLAEVPTDFRYCPKVPQTLSHARDLGANSAPMREFCHQMTQLLPKLGCCFLQLPPYFEPKQVPLLERFLDFWPREVPLAVEVRHEAFFEPTPTAEAYFDLLARRGVSAVITEVSGRRDVAHMRLTNHQVLVRFVGNSMHPSDLARIDEWTGRLAYWLERGLHEVYFFTHQPDNILAPDLAEYATRVFSKKISTATLRGPQRVVPPAQQGSLF